MIAAANSSSGSSRTALFLDRDGVINIEKGYVHRIQDFKFVDGIFELCRTAVGMGMLLVVITNQAGIARGYYSEQQFHALTRWMCNCFEAEGAPIAAVYFCPFHPDKGVGKYLQDSFDRKPNPGMIFRARDELGIDLSSSILIGDKGSDIQAGRSAGIGLSIFLGDASARAAADKVVNSLFQAVQVIASCSLRRKEKFIPPE